jgi:flagellar motor switch protein FliN
MTVIAKKIVFSEPKTSTEDKLLNDNYSSIIGNLEVECQVRLGTITMTVAELHQLKQNQILTLNQKTYEPVDVLLNNQLIARGQLMSVEDCFAIQITEIIS